MADAAACLSLNETAALCRKAAEGAGMSWGLAEEAGFAAAWLAARGIDGAAALLAHLTGSGPGGVRRVAGRWVATEDTPLCPVALGAALQDAASAADWGGATDAVSQPPLVLPFLAGVAAIRGCAIRADWGGGTIVIGADGPADAAEVAGLARAGTVPLALSLRPGPARASAPIPAVPKTLPRLAPATLAGLEALALRTTVPATAASRRGAGAGQGDND